MKKRVFNLLHLVEVRVSDITEYKWIVWANADKTFWGKFKPGGFHDIADLYAPLLSIEEIQRRGYVIEGEKVYNKAYVVLEFTGGHFYKREFESYSHALAWAKPVEENMGLVKNLEV